MKLWNGTKQLLVAGAAKTTAAKGSSSACATQWPQPKTEQKTKTGEGRNVTGAED
jgi:hypothetical protein